MINVFDRDFTIVLHPRVVVFLVIARSLVVSISIHANTSQPLFAEAHSSCVTVAEGKASLGKAAINSGSLD
jgi:hypothetical protein